MPEQAELIEGYFKKLTGSEEVKYEAFYPWIGRGAVVGNITDDDTAWEATLVKSFAKEESYEDVPTGDISSLAFLTQKPANYKESKAKIITKISNFGDSVGERIKEAIEYQKLVREFVDKWDLELRFYSPCAGLAKDRVTLTNVDGAGTFVSITDIDKAGKTPRFPLVIIQRFKDMKDNFVKAQGYDDYEIREILPPLDFQIEKFQELVKV